MIPVIIIPAYNPPLTFASLIDKIIESVNIDILIIDDGSLPPINIINNRIKLIRNKSNMGKGYSLQKAFKYSFEKNYTHAITMDSDSQHNPKDLVKFLSINSNFTFVLGKRKFNDSMPIHRRISNIITSFIISKLCNTPIYDSQSGYRRYKLTAVCSETYNESGFQFESEVLIKLLKYNNCTIKHVDIDTIYNNESSSISNINDTIKFIKLIARSIINNL